MRHSPDPPAPRARALVTFLRAVLVALAVVAGLIALVGIALQTPWGIRSAVSGAYGLTHPWPSTRLVIQGAAGGFLNGIELRGVRLLSDQGAVLVALDTVRIEYLPGDLIPPRLRIRRVLLAGPKLDATRWPVAVSQRTTPAKRSEIGLVVDRIEVRRGACDLRTAPLGRDSVWFARDVSIYARDLRVGTARSTGAPLVTGTLDTLAAAFGPRAEPAQLFTLNARAEITADALTHLFARIDGDSSHAIAEGDLGLAGQDSAQSGSLRVSFAPLAARDLRRFVPSLLQAEDVRLDVGLQHDGPAFVVRVHADAGAHGRLDFEGRGRPSLSGPVALQARAATTAIDLGVWSGRPAGQLVLVGTLDADLHGPTLERLSGPLSLVIDGSRVMGHRLERTRFTARFDEGRADLRVEGASEGFVIHMTGTSQPFAAPPSLDLAATLSIPALGRSGPRPAPGEPILVDGDLVADMSLRGDSLPEAVGRVSLVLRSRNARALFGGSRLDATLAQSAVHWSAGVDAAGGQVSAVGDLALGREPGWAIRDGVIRGVGLAALLGDTTASRLDARFHLDGRGAAVATAHASARLDSVALRYGPHRLAASTVAFDLKGGHGVLTADCLADDAVLAVRGELTSAAGTLRDAGLQVTFHGLDLARVTGDSSLTSRLGGRIEARLHGPDLMALTAARESGGPPPGTRGALHLTLDPSRWRGQDVTQLELSGELQDSDVALAGRMESTFGRMRLSGNARPFSTPRFVRIDPLQLEDLDLARLLGQPALAARLRGEIALTASRSDSAWQIVDARATLDGSRFHEVTFNRLAATGRLSDGRLEGSLDARSPSDSVRISIDGRLPARAGEPLRIAARGRARVDDVGALMGRDSLEAGADLDFDLDAAQEPRNGLPGLSVTGRIAGAAHFGAARLDTVRTEFALRGGQLELANLELHGNAADLSAAGRIALPGGGSRDSTALRLTATLRDPQPLAALTGARKLAAGNARLALDAAGPPGAVRITGGFTASPIRRDDNWADSLAVAFDGVVGDSTLTALDVRIRALSFVASGNPPRDVVASARWDGRALAVEGRADVDDRRWQEVAFRFTPGTGHSRIDLERFETSRENSRLSLPAPARITFGDGIQIDSLVIEQNGVPRLSMIGGSGPGDLVDLRAEIDSLEVTDYLDLAGIRGLTGRLSARAAVTGTRDQPVVEGSWNATLRADKRPATIHGRLRWAAGRFDGSTDFVQDAGQLLSVVAQLPLTLTLAPRPGESAVTMGDTALSLAVEARRFDLAWFGPLISPRVARKIQGTIDGRMEARGDPSLPDLQGGIAVTGARIEIPSAGTRHEADRIALGFSSRTVTLEPSVIRAGKGRLELSGRATFAGPGKRTFELHAVPSVWPVLDTPAAVLKLSGQVNASGSIEAPRVEGTLEVLSSTFYVGGNEGDRKLEKVQLSERDRRDLETRFSEPPARDQGPTLLDSLRADVTLTIGSGVWVRRRSDPVLALELAGKVRAQQQPGQLLATGRVDIQTGRSYLSFVGRRFDLTQAHVDLPGPIEGASAVLEAHYVSESSQSASAPDVTALVTVNKEGTNVDLRSVPFMDQAALINYLTTGQVQGEAAAGTASGLAVGSVLGAVGGAAGRSLGFQVVQVTQDAYGGQTLSAGNYVDPRIYLGFRQPVVQGQSSTTGGQNETNNTEFEVELEAARRLLFNVQGGGTQYRFLLRPRLGK